MSAFDKEGTMILKKFKFGLMAAASTATLAAFSAPVAAQDNEQVEQLQILGSRSARPRVAVDSPVPVDVINADDFNSLGNGSGLTDNLRALIPSYTASPATGDGSAFIRPTSLRGMSPDQTLILVNGKRRHRSALVQFFAPAAGNGAHGPDISMIPGIALQRVEVLRDGAAAQYGSDAIAGVINFVTREDSEGGQAVAQFGQFYEGESSYMMSARAGFSVGETGFITISGEWVDNDALSRGIIRPDAQALIDAGNVGVGADSPFGDAPFTQTWGRPETSATRWFMNAGFELGDMAEFYMHGNYAQTDGRYRFFYRNPGHSSIATLNGLGFTGLTNGYTPFLDGHQEDFSLVAGVSGELDGEMFYDFSASFGKNALDYFLNNTLNPSLGLDGSGNPVQRDFNVGGYEQEEINLNADFSQAIGSDINLAFGMEYRQETYVVNAGEYNSYFGAGSNGLGGFNPADSGTFRRDNWGAYIDIEQDMSDDFMVQYALRYEDYSDFGGTLNGKIAMRYNVSDNTTLRGAISTGFHAPTPGQSNVRTTITTFDGVTGLQVEEGLVPPTSAGALAVGGAALKEEAATNYSFGFTHDVNNNATLAIDFYRIEVNDRIYRTGDIAVPGSTTGATISFYTNAIDVVSQGVDVVLTSSYDWGDGFDTDLSFALNFNSMEVVGQSPVGGVNPVSASTIEDIENNYPDLRFVATANTHFNDRLNFMVRANFYGSHYDERGTIGAATSPSAEIDPTIYFDAEIGYQMTDTFRIVGGASNIFDTFIDEIGAPNANRLSVGLQYPRRSAANYEGGSWYFRGVLDF